ncbi:MAG TPA: hypothetical protein VFI65_19560 [Streptosporangiaceae bacterium]|nr:hypothetical protein [Streptosporangiaceae bacterium]
MACLAGAAGLAAIAAASVGTGAAMASAGSARPHVIHAAGRGHAKSARIINFRQRAKIWQSSHKKQATRPPLRTGQKASPMAAFTTAFDGISQAGCGDCLANPVVATSANGAQIVEATQTLVQVFDKNGTSLCNGELALNAFLNTPSATDPQLQYDNVADQFILTAIPAGEPSPPTLYVAVTTDHDACGNWRVLTVNLSGGPFTATSSLDLQFMGQDTRALLFSVINIDRNADEFDTWNVFTLSKDALYGDGPLNFATFPVEFDTVPVTTAGSPTIDSADSYFLSANFEEGYGLYTMTGSGTPTPTLTSRQQVGDPYLPPDGTPALEILFSSPVFDGSRIWFTQVVGTDPDPRDEGTAAVRYGYLNLADDSMTLAHISSAPHSWNLAPSINVSPNRDGTVSVFVNWMVMGNTEPTPVSDRVRSIIYPGSGPLPDSVATDQEVAVSQSGGDVLAPDTVSGTAIDPGTANGSCAVTAQQYVSHDGSWVTRVRRKCGPTPLS